MISRLRARRQGGFSMMEVLMVTVIVPIVGFAIFANFNSGLRLWKSIGTADPNEELTIFFQRTERDLEQAFKMKDLPFAGEPGKFEAAMLIETDVALGGGSAIGRAVYSYDASAQALIRETLNVHQLSEEKPGLKTRLLANVAAFKASYLMWDKERKIYEWLDAIDAEKQWMPAAVRFEMDYQTADALIPVQRVFYIPAGD